MDTLAVSFQSKAELDQELKRVTNQFSSPLIQLFSDQAELDINSYYQTVMDKWPNATVIGSSASHTIKEGKIKKGATHLIVSQFEQATFRSAAVDILKDKYLTSQTLYDNLPPNQNTKALICFGDRMSANDHELFSAFCHSPIPVAGGATACTDNGRWGFLNGQFYTDALIAVAIDSPNLHVVHKSYNEWNPIGATLTVTSAEENVLYELNHTPVHQIYQHYLADGEDMPVDKLHGFPLMKGEQIEQDIFTPINLSEYGGYVLDRELKVGDQVRFCYDHPELTIQQVKEGAYQLARFQPEQLFIYNCTSRLDFIEGDAELTPLQALARSDGFYCMGELYKEGMHQGILHHSMTFLALREGPAKAEFKRPTLDLSSTISPLFSMIRHSFADLEHHNSTMQEKIERQANQLLSFYRTDRLTGLPNREVLRENIAKMRNGDNLMTLKISNLTDINEKYGYSTGDQVLTLMTQRLTNQIQVQLESNPTLYSIGVGEWACIFSADVAMPEVREQFSNLIDKIEIIEFDQVGLPGNGSITAAVCAGIASKSDFPIATPGELLFKVIEARREAAKSHQSICNARNLTMEEDKRKTRLDRITIANHCVAHQLVIPFVQPLFDAKSKAVSSYECLVRLNYRGEILNPGYFLPYIQDTRIYRRMSQQMITRSFELMDNRPDRFSINLSPTDVLDEKTLELIESQLLNVKDPSRVGLEIVESEQIKDFNRMIEACDRFRQLGATIIVDDFGSGYSNIDEIIRLEPGIIKLDGSLIKTIDVDPKQRKIASQLIRLCNVFEAKTVAEFVHNKAVCDIATDIGVDYLQGFYLGEPKPLK